MDSEEIAAPLNSKKVNKNEVGDDWEIVSETPSKVTHGCGRARSPS
jgi:hypothetical protein